MSSRVALVGPVHPFRAGIAYCTTRLAEELRKSHEVTVVSFSRQYPKRFYPGGDDVDPTLPRAEASFALDVVNPLTWIREGWKLRRDYDAVVFVWWIWVWALPYLTMIKLLPRHTRVILQCHNIGDKEPAAWKRWLSNLVLRRGNVLVVHARTELADAIKRARGRRTIKTFLPVHELGGAIPSREEARATLGLSGNVALFFGHVRPFKGLDIALRAWRLLKSDVTLLVAGEAWWKREEEYRALAAELGLPVSSSVSSSGSSEFLGSSGSGAAEELRGTPRNPEELPPPIRFDFRFIPDAEIATYFAAADVVLAPYRIEAQSGVALTAFHFARPVIATLVGGLPEIIEEGRNGLLVEPEDPAALAKAVDAFFARADREAMERHAAASARKYSWAEYGSLIGALVQGR